MSTPTAREVAEQTTKDIEKYFNQSTVRLKWEIIKIIQSAIETALTQARGETVPMMGGLNITNGGQKCDILVGPCACGAWHSATDALTTMWNLHYALQSQLNAANDKLNSLYAFIFRDGGHERTRLGDKAHETAIERIQSTHHGLDAANATIEELNRSHVATSELLRICSLDDGLKEAIAKLKAERDAATCAAHPLHDRIKTLEEALEPFEKSLHERLRNYSPYLDMKPSDDDLVTVTLGDCRKARDARGKS